MKHRPLSDDIYRIVRPYLPPALMSEESLEKIGRFVSFMPASITNAFGFECQMARVNSDADFFMRVTERGARDFLSQLSSRIETNPGSGWRGIERYCVEWKRSNNSPHDVVRHIWLEFDSSAETTALLEPSILFWHSPASRSAAKDAELQTNLLDYSARLLSGNSISAASRKRVLEVIRQLPGNAFVFCVGVMIAREEKEFRVCLKNFRHSEILPFLQSINWQGRLDKVQEVLSLVGPCSDRIQVILGIDQDISNRLHLEFRCDEDFQPGAMKRWRLLLDRLIEMGIATPERADALLGWPGFPFDQLSPGLSENLYVRVIDHVKIVVDAEGELQAKCYFGVWETVRVAF